MFSRRPHVRPGLRSFRPRVECLEDRTLPSGISLGFGNPAVAPTQAQVAAAYGQAPLSFQLNEGQSDASVQFLAHGPNYTLFLTDGGSVLSLDAPSGASGTVSMQLAGANPNAPAIGMEKLAAVSNYLIGNDPTKWHTDVPNYAQVEYQNVYPGINLVYFGNQSQLEYNFVVAAGAKPGVIQMTFQGALGSTLDGQGNLVLHTAGGDIVEQAPVLYQMIDGVRQSVSGSFVLQSNGQVGFAVGTYDHRLPLTIDPVLLYSTPFGNNGSGYGWGVAVDKAGDAYIVGASNHGITLLNPIDTPPNNGAQYAFISEFNPSGTALVFSTYLGGTDGANRAFAIALDGANNIYVTGDTSADNFPVTGSAYQKHNGKKMAGAPSDASPEDAFVAKLAPSGKSLLYATYFGGYGSDLGSGIAVDKAGNATVVGSTQSVPGSGGGPEQNNFPTLNAYQNTFGGGGRDAFVARFNTSGGLLYSTYLGGSADDAALATQIGGGNFVALDSAGNAYVTGTTASNTNFPTKNAMQGYGGGDFDAFVTEFTPSGSVVYSTYLGGENIDAGHAIAVDGLGNAYIVGVTFSTAFPGPMNLQTGNSSQTSNAAGDEKVFVAKIAAGGTGIDWSTYLGGNQGDDGYAIALDAFDNVYIAGSTGSLDSLGSDVIFPTTNAVQPMAGGGTGDGFVTKINAAGTQLIYSTFLGGSHTDLATGIAVDSAGSAYVTGITYSSDFPTVHPFPNTFSLGGTQAFLSKIGKQVVTHFQIQVTPPAASEQAGTSFNVSVTALDASNKVVPDYEGTIRFTSTDVQALLPKNYSFTPNDAGTHTFPITLGTAGTDGLSVFDVAAPKVMGSLNISVVPGAISKFNVTGFPNGLGGTAHNFTVTAVDGNGNKITNFAGTIQFLSSDGAATLPLLPYTFKPATDKGTHTFSATLRTRGSQSIGVDDTADSLSGEQDNILVSPATHFSVTVAAGTITAGTPFTITVTALDALNQTDTAYTGTIAFTSSDAQVTPGSGLSANYPFVSMDAGVKQFTVTLDTAGSQTITATDTSHATITGKGTFVVSPTGINKFQVSGYPSTTMANASHSFTVTALDSYGNHATGYTGTIQFSSSDNAAVFSKTSYMFLPADKGSQMFTVVFKTRGSQSIMVQDSSNFKGSQTGILVAPATQFSASGFSATVTAGVAFNVTLTAHDALNQTDTAYADTVTFKSSDPNLQPGDLPVNYPFTNGDTGMRQFTITLATVGKQTVTFMDTTRTSVLGKITVTVVPNTMSSFLVSYPSNVLANTSHSLVVTATDARGNRITAYGGTITFTGNVQGLPASYKFIPTDMGRHTFPMGLTATGNQPVAVSDGGNHGNQNVGVYTLSASISGPSVGVPGQPLTFSLFASSSALPANVVFTYKIDWNGDGIIDQTVTGPNGKTVTHTYTGVGSNTMKVTAVDSSSVPSAPTMHAVAITNAALETDPSDSSQTALFVGGTTGNDTIFLLPTNSAGNSILVSVNGTPQGTFTPSAKGHVYVYTQSGNDTVQEMTSFIGSTTVFITVPAVIEAGAGNDTLIAAGSSAANILVGGSGTNLLIGGAGRNILIGGTGADTIYGGQDDDIFIPGATNSDPLALLNIMSEWNSGTVYATRVAHILGTMSGGANMFFLNKTTVKTDMFSDTMYGEGGQDWFFATTTGLTPDKIKDKQTGEMVTPI